MFEKEKPDPVFVRIPTPIGKKMFQVVGVDENKVTVFDDLTGVPMVLENAELVEDVIDYCKEKRRSIPVIE